MMWYIVVDMSGPSDDFQGAFASLEEAKKAADEMPLGYYGMIFEYPLGAHMDLRGKTYQYIDLSGEAPVWKKAEKPY